MNWPQVFMIGMFSMALGIHITKHGEPKRENYNAWVMIAAIAIKATILYFGGFWE